MYIENISMFIREKLISMDLCYIYKKKKQEPLKNAKTETILKVADLV
jgi:hypothetical protein